MQAGAYTAFGGASLDVLIPDNDINAYRIRQGALDYIHVSTVNSSENITFGNALGTVTYNFIGSGVTDFAGPIDAAGMTTTTLVTTSSLTVNGGLIDLNPTSSFLCDTPGAQTRFTIQDNIDNSFQVRAGGALDNWIVMDTRNGAEVFELGNAVQNPQFSILGTGNIRFDTAGDRVFEIEASASTIDGSDFTYGGGASGPAGGGIPGGVGGTVGLVGPDGGVGSALAIGGGGANAELSAGAGGADAGGGAGPNGSVNVGTKNALSVSIGNGGSAINIGLGSSTIGMFGVVAVSQPVSAGITAGFTMNAGTAVLDDSTFTGGVGASAYTLGDVVRALKDLGGIAL